MHPILPRQADVTSQKVPSVRMHLKDKAAVHVLHFCIFCILNIENTVNENYKILFSELP